MDREPGMDDPVNIDMDLEEALAALLDADEDDESSDESEA